MDNSQSAAGKEATRIMGVNDIEASCLPAIILIAINFYGFYGYYALY